MKAKLRIWSLGILGALLSLANQTNDYVSGGFTDKTALNGPYIETGISF